MCIQTGVGTEFTTEHAYIGGFNMKVAVEVSGIPVLFFPDIIGEGTHECKTAFFKKEQAFFICYPFVVLNFLGDGSEAVIGNAVDQNINGSGHCKNFYKFTVISIYAIAFLGIILLKKQAGVVLVAE
jgi:hypothetical protein